MDLTNEDIALDLAQCPQPLAWSDVFARSAAPVEIEVGVGKGTFLLNQARCHPDINYLGIEWANEYYRFCVDRMRRWQMTHVRVLRADARDFIAHFVPDATVQAYHVYFPDPWPKKRHHKRRFFAPPNILQVARTLQPGGELRVATDHAEYFEVIREVLLEHEPVARLFERTDFLPADAAGEGEWVGSNFERKYIQEGRRFHTLALRRR